jgi:hypothetical protein
MGLFLFALVFTVLLLTLTIFAAYRVLFHVEQSVSQPLDGPCICCWDRNCNEEAGTTRFSERA